MRLLMVSGPVVQPESADRKRRAFAKLGLQGDLAAVRLLWADSVEKLSSCDAGCSLIQSLH
jgi:hypothetical protein